MASQDGGCAGACMHLRLRRTTDEWGFRRPVLEWASAREVAAQREAAAAEAAQLEAQLQVGGAAADAMGAFLERMFLF